MNKRELLTGDWVQIFATWKEGTVIIQKHTLERLHWYTVTIFNKETNTKDFYRGLSKKELMKLMKCLPRIESAEYDF